MKRLATVFILLFTAPFLVAQEEIAILPLKPPDTSWRQHGRTDVAKEKAEKILRRSSQFFLWGSASVDAYSTARLLSLPDRPQPTSFVLGNTFYNIGPIRSPEESSWCKSMGTRNEVGVIGCMAVLQVGYFFLTERIYNHLQRRTDWLRHLRWGIPALNFYIGGRHLSAASGNFRTFDRYQRDYNHLVPPGAPGVP